MRELIVNEKDDGQRLNKYLSRYLPAAGSAFLYKMLRKKNILLNGSRATGDAHVQTGDRIRLFLSEETIEKFRAGGTGTPQKPPSPGKEKRRGGGLFVLYQNQHILAADKPAGLLCQKARASDDSLNDRLLSYMEEQERNEEVCFKPSVMNRLDRNTSGIVLCGLTALGSRLLAEALRERTVEKYYHAVVQGHFSQEGRVTSYLRKNEERNLSTVIGEAEYRRLFAGAQREFLPIVTEYHAVKPLRDRSATLLRIRLVTGKSHQIRAQLSYLGHPILGDPKYGNAELNRELNRECGLQRQLLHASEVLLPEKLAKKTGISEADRRIVSPLPKEFDL